MTNFHWSDFAVPAMLLGVCLIIALATWLLHLLFPSASATPKTKNAIAVDRISKVVHDQSVEGIPNDETMSHVPP